MEQRSAPRACTWFEADSNENAEVGQTVSIAHAGITQSAVPQAPASAGTGAALEGFSSLERTRA
jgi:hypothetical protein